MLIRVYIFFQQKLTYELAEIRDKLEKVREAEPILQPSVFGAENGIPVYRTVEEKFSGFTKKDGSMDTIKVKTTLQQQQKLQKQVLPQCIA